MRSALDQVDALGARVQRDNTHAADGNGEISADEKAVGELFRDVAPISLERTNDLAQMLNRFDNKYIVSLGQFSTWLNSVKAQFAILEIKKTRQFSYNSCYYDDEFGCYFDHHQGRRRRFKVRTREYVDSGDTFFEIKLKGLRGQTNKKRIPCDFLTTPEIMGGELELLSALYLERYKRELPYKLRPALLVTYKRCTMVSLGGGERVTIDYGLKFAAPEYPDEKIAVGSEFIIVETKSGDGNGIADKALKELKIRKASKCSKYCIGVNLTGRVTKNNEFRAVLNQVRSNLVAGAETLSHRIQPVTTRNRILTGSKT